ncbi:MAG TPA: HAD family hydrolase [Candidatus Binataceae bacterium]|nr:HAD family hydrolase [Candidatus Binataceae bacterium]
MTSKAKVSHSAKSRQTGAARGKVKALLFDFGGTLAFLDFDLLAREFSREGRKLDPLTLEHAEYAGRAAIDRHLMGGRRDVIASYAEFFRDWMNAAGIPDEEIPAHGERFRAIHREATLWRVVRPGTFETLERLKSAGYKLAIVSNAEGQVESDCRRFGLAPYFDTIIDSHVVGVEKPDPRIFKIALDRLGIAPEEARFTGDIYSVDILGARAAGIEAALVDLHGRYDWVEHEKIRHISEIHPLD